MDIPLYVDEEIKHYAVEITKQGYQKIQIENIEIFDHIHACLKVSLRPLLSDETNIKLNIISSMEKKPCNMQPWQIKKFTFPAYVAFKRNHQRVYLDGTSYLKSIANANVNPTWPLDILKTTISELLFTTFQQAAAKDSIQDQIYVIDETCSCMHASIQLSYDIVDKLLMDILEKHQNEWILPVDDSFHSSIRSMEDIIYHKHLKISSIQGYGTQGDIMSDLQTCLSFLANFYEELPPLRVTHIFDNETKDAIIAFQNLSHTQVSGLLDSTTQTNLISVCTRILELIDPQNQPMDYPDSLQDMKTVCMIQRAINTVASMYPAIPNILVDGIMHDRCVNAIKVFQELFQIHGDGIIDQNTWNMLFTTASKIESGIFTTQGMPPFPKKPLSLGASGASVLLIQNRLQTISNFYSSIPFIDADACFGVATHQCVLAFQDLLGLRKDGVVDHFTWTLLHQVYQEVIRI